jgi:hypothetical protein
VDISRCYQLAVSFIAIFDRLKTEISKKICWHWTKTSIPTRMRMSSSMLNDKNKTLAKYQNKNSLWTFKILIWDQSTSYICYMFLKKYLSTEFKGTQVAQWVRSLDLTAHTSLSPIRRGFAPSFVNYKKGALDSQSQVIKFTSCLPRVGGSLRVLRLPPPLKLVAMI